MTPHWLNWAATAALASATDHADRDASSCSTAARINADLSTSAHDTTTRSRGRSGITNPAAAISARHLSSSGNTPGTFSRRVCAHAR